MPFALQGLPVFGRSVPLMFLIVVRVDAFRGYYQSVQGSVVLVAVALTFAALVSTLGLIARVGSWTRWDLRRLADEQERLKAR
ncbi:MAG: hypothetical protein M3R48_05755 [Candidatus Dormibacteraeota bacterium]|nr:hypothetical protein [Candidatus Dormibacteraeota bacterium]